MSAKYSFHLQSGNDRLRLPTKIIIGQRGTETPVHVLLKLFGYLMFYRDRLQIEPRLDLDVIPFEPDLVQLDYELRPVLWIECGECSVARLDRLAVKVPAAALWVLKRSPAAAEHLLHDMAKHGLRRDRYHVVAFEAALFDEVLGQLQSRNQVFWLAADFAAGALRFDFNGLWFEGAFTLTVF